MNCWRLLIVLFSIVVCIANPAQAERRVALVIGNSGYRNAPELINPRNDAEDMATRLGQLGFTVTQGRDLDLAGMRATVREFVRQLTGADIALLYYAGHGLQVNGINYMVPIDAALGSHDDLEFEALTMDLVLASMERNAKVNLVILDACRDNPLARNLARSMGTRSAAVGSGLARIGSGVGTLIAFATQPGNVALDGTGRNSPFTAALLRHLGTPGQDITRDLIHVRREVLEATDGRQVPWDNSSLTGEVILAPAVAGAQADPVSAERSALLKRIAELEATQRAHAGEQRKLEDAGASQQPAARDGAPAAGSEFDKSLLARLDPNASVDVGEAVSAELAPQQLEERLKLGPEDYKRVQAALNILGYSAGAEDGVFGATARAELRKYQIRNGVRESGYLTEPTLLALLKTIESVPRSYDGKWQLEFHRYNYGPDPVGTNQRTLMAAADVEVRNGEFFILGTRMFTSSKNYFDTFRGTLTKDGKLSIKMRINTLFGQDQERDVSVSGALPKLVPVDSSYSFKGSKLWSNEKIRNDEAWLRLDIRRIKS